MPDESESVTLYVVRTHRVDSFRRAAPVAFDYHTTGDREQAQRVRDELLTGRYPPDRVEIVERITTTTERVIG